jgi:putative peptidoglycan lipid II flippase
MLKAARTVLVFGIVSQGAGFARLLIVAAYFGAGPLLDAYYLGLVIPTFLVGITSGILQSSFVPLYIDAKTCDDRDAVRRLRSVALTWTFGALALVAAAVTLAQTPALSLFSTGVDPAIREALGSSFVPLMWTAPLNGLSDAMGMLMNAEGLFTVVAFAPVINIVVSVAVLALWPTKGTDALIWSLFAGLLTQVLLVVLAMRRAGLGVRPGLQIGGVLSASVAGIAVPVLLSNVLNNVVPAALQLMSGRTGAGAVSALGYATRLHNVIVQTAVMSVSTVLLPHFARLISEQKSVQLRASLERVFAATLILFLAVLTFVAAAGPGAVGLLLEHGRFTHADRDMVAEVWLALTAGLLGTTWTVFLVKLFQALQRPWVIAQLAVVSVISNVASAWVLMSMWGVVGIALANSLTYTVIMMLFHRFASQTVGSLLTGAVFPFVLCTTAANVLAYFAAVLWAASLSECGIAVEVIGQALIIAAANLLVARMAPLRLPLRALMLK